MYIYRRPRQSANAFFVELGYSDRSLGGGPPKNNKQQQVTRNKYIK